MCARLDFILCRVLTRPIRPTLSTSFSIIKLFREDIAHRRCQTDKPSSGGFDGLPQLRTTCSPSASTQTPLSPYNKLSRWGMQLRGVRLFLLGHLRPETTRSTPLRTQSRKADGVEKTRSSCRRSSPVASHLLICWRSLDRLGLGMWSFVGWPRVAVSLGVRGLARTWTSVSLCLGRVLWMKKKILIPSCWRGCCRGWWIWWI